jgi:hypothetical protein
MAFKSSPVAIATTDTDVYEMGATLEGAVVLGIGNANGSARTVTVKFYKHALASTVTLVSGYSIAANTFTKFPIPISMQAGDKIIMAASNADSIVASPTVTDSQAVPNAIGFTPRGEWADDVEYDRNDLVRVEDAIEAGRGATYISLLDENLDNDPTSEPTFWMAYVADGPAGSPAASSTTTPGVVEKATDAEVYAAAADKNLAADHIETASALVALTDAAPVAVDWDAGINFSLTVTASRQIGNPTNGQPGTYRTILVQGNDGTDRTITFGNQFLGDVPAVADCDSGKWYLLTIRCIT